MISTNFPISAETWLVPIYPISAEMLDTHFYFCITFSLYKFAISV
jgi:hypothetical protein